MSDYVPITKVLRKQLAAGAGTALGTGFGRGQVVRVGDLLDECDDIDALHKALEDENAELRKELAGNAEVMAFVERLSDAVEKRKDVTLWGVDYLPYPVDADKVPIHVGDVMKGEKIGGGFGEPFEVVGYIMSKGELEPMDKHKLPRIRKYLHHHHEPTVADVLREFADDIITFCTSVEDHECEDAIEEFSKRLRLAKEES